MQNLLKQFILESLEEQEDKKSSKKSDLLLEPDDSVYDETDESCMKKEQSVAGAVSGATTPLGTGPGYSGKSKSPAYKAGSKKDSPNTKKRK
jgi:hypothetical protein